MVAVLAETPDRLDGVRQPAAVRTHPNLPRYVRPERPVPSAAMYLRRGIAALALLAALLAAGLVLVAPRFRAALGGVPASASAGGPNIGTYVVLPGDTVWSIAEHLAPGCDPRPLVDTILAANRGGDIVVGQVLRIPR